MIAESKAQLRKQMLMKRNALSEKEIKEKSREIKEKLFSLPEFKEAETVAFYISKGSEVATREMIDEAIEKGKEIVVPVTNDEIEFVKYSSNLKIGKFGVPEPEHRVPEEKEPDLVILPGLAFDLDLHRLGYGKGYYDKKLKSMKSKRIGICFDLQVVDAIPRHEHDERLDLTITEKRKIEI